MSARFSMNVAKKSSFSGNRRQTKISILEAKILKEKRRSLKKVIHSCGKPMLSAATYF